MVSIQFYVVPKLIGAVKAYSLLRSLRADTSAGRCISSNFSFEHRSLNVGSEIPVCLPTGPGKHRFSSFPRTQSEPLVAGLSDWFEKFSSRLWTREGIARARILDAGLIKPGRVTHSQRSDPKQACPSCIRSHYALLRYDGL